MNLHPHQLNDESMLSHSFNDDGCLPFDDNDEASRADHLGDASSWIIADLQRGRYASRDKRCKLRKLANLKRQKAFVYSRQPSKERMSPIREERKISRVREDRANVSRNQDGVSGKTQGTSRSRKQLSLGKSFKEDSLVFQYDSSNKDDSSRERPKKEDKKLNPSSLSIHLGISNPSFAQQQQPSSGAALIKAPSLAAKSTFYRAQNQVFEQASGALISHNKTSQEIQINFQRSDFKDLSPVKMKLPFLQAQHEGPFTSGTTDQLIKSKIERNLRTHNEDVQKMKVNPVGVSSGKDQVLSMHQFHANNYHALNYENDKQKLLILKVSNKQKTLKDERVNYLEYQGDPGVLQHTPQNSNQIKKVFHARRRTEYAPNAGKEVEEHTSTTNDTNKVPIIKKKNIVLIKEATPQNDLNRDRCQINHDDAHSHQKQEHSKDDVTSANYSRTDQLSNLKMQPSPKKRSQIEQIQAIPLEGNSDFKYGDKKLYDHRDKDQEVGQVRRKSILRPQSQLNERRESLVHQDSGNVEDIIFNKNQNTKHQKDSENFGSILANAGFVGNNFSFGLKAGVFSPSPVNRAAVPKTNSAIKQLPKINYQTSLPKDRRIVNPDIDDHFAEVQACIKMGRKSVINEGEGIRRELNERQQLLSRHTVRSPDIEFASQPRSIIKLTKIGGPVKAFGEANQRDSIGLFNEQFSSKNSKSRSSSGSSLSKASDIKYRVAPMTEGHKLHSNHNSVLKQKQQPDSPSIIYQQKHRANRIDQQIDSQKAAGPIYNPCLNKTSVKFNQQEYIEKQEGGSSSQPRESTLKRQSTRFTTNARPSVGNDRRAQQLRESQLNDFSGPFRKQDFLPATMNRNARAASVSVKVRKASMLETRRNNLSATMNNSAVIHGESFSVNNVFDEEEEDEDGMPQRLIQHKSAVKREAGKSLFTRFFSKVLNIKI
ncbi:hypothetical protein FGO68_gene10354 [Halteria grandinella]|uniref:Uncharacterized protein n=1 Tax=Halteria grandinella TaxID=5974 RepID=A0A8J8P3F5_HALGN|nr:hypothetical protein FGO68_gene10354 [Halteria grandinella]